MTFLTIAAILAIGVGTAHTAHLIATDGLTRVATRRS